MGLQSEGDKKPVETAAQQTDTNSKGKGVADGDSGQDTEGLRDGSSIMSRLGQSAAGLSRSVLQSTPTASDLASVASSGKPGPSSSATRSDALAESSDAASSSTFRGAFRPRAADVHTAAEEAAFSNFLDSTDVFMPTEAVGLEKAWQVANAKAPGATVYGSHREAAASSVAEQQERDGVEVVRLLSQVDDEMPAYESQTILRGAELEDLRRALFEDGASTQVSASDWNSILNFIPDFLRVQGGDQGGAEAAESSLMNLGVADTAEAGQLWLEGWNRVLTGYTDEVWGDVGDLVQQARTEIQQIKAANPGQQTDPLALRRLQATLKRVRAKL